MSWQVILIVACAQLQVFYTDVEGATPSVAGCPRYVEEGGTLTCTCTKGDCTSSDVTLSWRDHDPASPTLLQTDVQRQDNGSPFTCQMVCGGETSTVTYTLQVGYGPSADSMSILGNTTVIADGTRLLNLTCLATDVNPAPSYAWLDSVCRDHYQGSTCSVIPQPSQDGTIVRCRASDKFRDIPVTVVTEAKLELLFPPTAAPVISGSGSTPGQIVKTGDNLTCTVTGSRPVVKYVTFSCSNPDHEDKDDVTEEYSVSSSVTVDTFNVSKDNDTMTCYCSGYWAPEPDLYTLHTNVSFYTEYNASLSHFTVNGSEDDILTLNESDHVAVTLECRAYGRPAPRVYVTKNGTEEMVSNGVPDMLVFSQNITYTMSPAVCEDTGNYTAVVNDGSTNTDERKVQILVNCAPRLPKRISSDVDECPDAITEDGFDLLVVANPSPSPDDVTVTYLGDTLDKDIFTLLTLQQHSISLCETKLEVRVTDFTELPDGEYRLSVSNTLGSFNCSFPRMKKKDPHSANIGAIAGGTAAALVGIIIIIVVIACCCRRKLKDQDKENVDAIHNEGAVNPKFVEDGSVSGSNHDNDSGIEMNGGSSPLEMSPRQSDGAGYASLSDYPPSGHHSGEFRKKSGRAAAYEVTSITSTGKVNIKTAAPQPNAYQDPWDIKKGDMTQAGAPGGPPTPHNLGPKGDEYAMISNAKNKTSITVGPKGDEYSTVVKYGKGDNTQGSPVKAQGPEDVAASQGPPLSMTPHPLDTPGYATLAQMAPAQEHVIAREWQ